MEGVGEDGRGGMTQYEQRGAVAFTGATIATVVIPLITVWQYLF
jgi:hypothetical protein